MDFDSQESDRRTDFLIFYHKSKLYVEIYVWKFAIGINLGGVI